MGNAITNISSYINQRNGVSGLISGLDTDSLVKAAMKYDQARVDKVFQKKEKLAWQSDAIRAVNNQLRTLSNDFTSSLKNAQNMLAENTYKGKKTTVTGDTEAATIVAGPKANLGDYTLKVVNLAQGASAKSASRLSSADSELGKISVGSSLSDISKVMKSDTLEKLPYEFSFTFDKDVSYTESGVTKTKTEKFSFTFSGSDSLEHIMNTVNASGAGVKMAYSQISDQLSITATDTAQSTIKFKDTDGFLDAFGITQNSVAGPTKATYELNGKTYTSDTNSLSVDGLTITLKKPSEIDEEKGTAKVTKFTVDNDFTKVVENVKKFIEEYNKIVNDITDKLNEKPIRGFEPLTDEMRGSLKESEVKLWDEKSKTGLLYRNAELTKMMSNIRQVVTQTMPSGYTIMEMGITCKSTRDASGKLVANMGTLELDETKLMAMLGKNPDAVYRTFAGDSSIAEKPADSTEKSGAIGRIFGCMKNYLSESTYTTLTQNSTRISNWETDMTTLIDKMKTKTDALYRKYSAMESALSKLSGQSSFFSNLSG